MTNMDHLMNWATEHLTSEEAPRKLAQILDFMRDYPDRADRYGYAEILRIIERNEREGISA